MDHGGNIREAEERYGFAPGEMLDLSTGICPRPYRIPESLLEPEDWRGLPQREDEEALEAAFRSAHNVPDEAVVLAAPGSQILISQLPLLGKAGPVAIPDPAYSEHALAWKRGGYEVVRHPAGESPPDVPSVVVVQPGNPLGEEYNSDGLLELAENAVIKGGIVVVDEAFADLKPSLSLLRYTGRPGLVVLRSFGKFYGLAGLRLGLAAGHTNDIQRLKEMLGPWPISSLTLKIGVMAVADKDFQEEQRKWIKARAEEMGKVLKKRGLSVAGSTGLFVLVEDPTTGDLHRHLAENGIWTRVFDYNTNWLRIGLADETGRDRLDAVLVSWRSGSK